MTPEVWLVEYCTITWVWQQHYITFFESFKRQLILYIILYLNKACKVLTPAFTNSSLALLQLGFLSKILKQSL